MPIANYTTTVPVSRTLAEVQAMLVSGGAQSVMIDFVDGLPAAMSFLMVRGPLRLTFRLPCDWRAAQQVLLSDKRTRSYATDEHAQRVAWRVLRDWLRAQLALIEIGAAAFEQVMLPYIVTPTGETLYARLSERHFKLLEFAGDAV